VHRHTPPLPGNADANGLPVLSDGYRLIELVHKYWVSKGKPLVLDEWQQHLLVRILERCPEGHPRAGQLRYRQVVVSIPRQAGKSLLAAILSLYGLLQHCHSPKVLGVARSVQQANVVYGYTADAITQSKTLRSVLSPTGTRGITQARGLGSYKVLPAKPEAVQGYESTLSICDELHVMKPEIWDAIVASQRAQTDPLLVGITTAGDISSTLLKRLYAQGEAAINGAQESFGFFVWEASDPSTLSLGAITEANPAVQGGRISAQTILADDKASPPSHWQRFTLNRFVDGLAEPWVPVEAWAKCAGTGIDDFSNAYFSIEIADMWAYATITATKKIDGKIHQTLVARLVKPDLEQLKDWCKRLRKAGKATFVMDGYRKTKSLAEWLVDKGYQVHRIGSGGSRSEAANLVYSLVMRNQINHDNQPLVNTQHALARTKTTGDSLSIVSGGHDIDACYASVYGIYAAETLKKRSSGIG